MTAKKPTAAEKAAEAEAKAKADAEAEAKAQEDAAAKAEADAQAAAEAEAAAQATSEDEYVVTSQILVDNKVVKVGEKVTLSPENARSVAHCLAKPGAADE